MPELFIELLSEEIPSRLQRPGAEALGRALGEALAALSPGEPVLWWGPRRIACALEVAASVAATRETERGPRTTAPERAVEGFLRKHKAGREALREEGGFWLLDRAREAVAAPDLIAGVMPDLLWRFQWPKAMRWGGPSRFVWVRPLRRIVCLLGGEVVRFRLARDEGDDAHGLASGEITEGHRFLAPGPIVVGSRAEWEHKLRAAHVIADGKLRRALIAEGLERVAPGAGEPGGLEVVADGGLLDEVAGLVEEPHVLLGRIADEYMDLPAEVMRTSMRANQRYFALSDREGRPAPYFAFVAGVPGRDGGAAIVAGNERVLRARFADARHFWDHDRDRRLESRLPALDGITFHARLGSQGQRAGRIAVLAAPIAEAIGADATLAHRAGLLAKADLTSGMVGEFPELQGVMGGYYAAHDGEPAEVASAIRQHYQPRGPSDPVPEGGVAQAVALADKLDQLSAFFAAGEKPTGSGDPFALRRAALGVVRIIRERRLRLSLSGLLLRAVVDASHALSELAPDFRPDAVAAEVLAFLHERLRVQLRAEGARHDVLAAVGAGDDLTRLLARTEAVAGFIATEDGANLLAACKRAANILRIEGGRDGPHAEAPDASLYREPEERALAAAVGEAGRAVAAALDAEDDAAAMRALAALRPPLDAFFDRVTVNAPEPQLRRNRLALLYALMEATGRVADFTRIEG